MGAILVKDGTGWKGNVTPYVRTASGFARVKAGWRKTSSTVWSQFLTVDNVPPGLPTVYPVTVDASGRATITIKAPISTDVKTLRVKVGKSIATNIDTGSDYYSTPDGNDTAWSEWMVSPGQTRTKYYPLVGELTPGTTYYVTAWAQDSARNFSAPVMISFKFTGEVITVPVAKSAYIATTDSSTMRRVQNTWVRTDKYVRAGGPNESIGLWYYSNRLLVQLQNAKKLTKVSILVQRLNANDYDGASKFRIFAHNQPGWSQADIDSGGKIIRSSTTYNALKRGQSITLTIDPAWYPDILSGKIAGFGVVSQAGTGLNATDAYNGTYQGNPTTSGRVYMEYTE